jgi:hypothetical protein
MSETEGAIPADLTAMAPEDFAALIGGASDEQIAEIIDGPSRTEILDEVFRRMTEHVVPGQIDGLDAVVHFVILDRPEDQGGGEDHYEVVFANGACEANSEPSREPNVTMRLDGVNFLKLAGNKVAGPTLFMSGKLKLEGDVMLASRLTSVFAIPSAS